MTHLFERTFGRALDHYTALYKSFQEHCTLTNKAVDTIYWDMSKPPRGDKALILVPSNCYSLGNPSVIGPDLAHGSAEHSLL